jgi:hypothetical protein
MLSTAGANMAATKFFALYIIFLNFNINGPNESNKNDNVMFNTCLTNCSDKFINKLSESQN